MSARHPVTKSVQEFEPFCPQLGEGLTDRAERLESGFGAAPLSGGRAQATDQAEHLAYQLALGAAPGSNARWLEGVLAEDELRQPDEQGSRCAEQRWKQFRDLADLLAFTLEQTKYAKLAPSVRSCHRVFSGLMCSNGHTHAKAKNSCAVRLCPYEMRTRSMRSLHRFRSIIEGLPHGKYVVLAERNAAPGDLAEGIQHLFESWNRLRKMPIFSGVRGSLIALEITYNREMMEPDFTGERLPWHPHLNVVLDAPFIPFEELRDSWALASEGRGRTAFIRAVDRGTANELLKYVTKLLDFIDIPLAVEEFLASTHRKRFIRTYGSLYGLKIEDEAAGCCPDCDSRTLRVVAHTLYAHQVFFDPQGILRFHQWALVAPPQKSRTEVLGCLNRKWVPLAKNVAGKILRATLTLASVQYAISSMCYVRLQNGNAHQQARKTLFSLRGVSQPVFFRGKLGIQKLLKLMAELDHQQIYSHANSSEYSAILSILNEISATKAHIKTIESNAFFFLNREQTAGVRALEEHVKALASRLENIVARADNKERLQDTGIKP